MNLAEKTAPKSQNLRYLEMKVLTAASDLTMRWSGRVRDSPSCCKSYLPPHNFTVSWLRFRVGTVQRGCC
ncbi:MAG: hypothetical protein LVT47_06305 [Cyanobacteria bacterium LVE1205-1]